MSTAFRVGLFVFLALLFLSTGVFLIGNKDFLFSSTYRLKAEFQNVAGLNNGADVRVGGIHQGTIKEIDLPSDPDGKVTVVMSVRSSTRNLIKKDSRAAIKTEGLLGDKYIEISFGSAKAESVANNDIIAGEQPQDLSQQARILTDQASQGLTAIRDDAQALQHNFLLREFFEKRGYNESSELTKHAVTRVPKERPAKEFEYDPKDLFDKPDNAKLKNKSKMDEVGKYLEENGFGLVVIASSEAKGEAEKDRVLTEARANVVREYLVQNFKINDKRVDTIGLGKNKESDKPSRLSVLIYPAKSATETKQNPASASP